MSFRYLEGVRKLQHSVTPAERLVLFLLAHHSNNEGYSFPSIRTLSSESSITERGVYKILANLKDGGFVSSSRNGPHGCNLYRLLIAPIDHPQRVSTGGPVGNDQALNIVHLPPEHRASPPCPRGIPTPALGAGKLKGTDIEGGREFPPSSLRLSGAERISLEREDKILEAEFRSLQSDFMSDAERLRRREIKERRQKIKERLFIPL